MPGAESKRAATVVVEGRVQGVGFRYSAQREANRLGLTGWVRNLDDGSVEVWCEGPEDKVNAMIEWLREGPTGSWVRGIKVDHAVSTGRYKTFSITF